MKKYLLFLLFCSLCACKTEPKQQVDCDTISIETSKITEGFTLNINDSICEFIFLETNEQSLVGEIDKTIIRNDKIFLLDKYVTESVLVFNHSGKFLYKIANIGRGPGEFSMPNDIIVDEKGNEISILDIDQKKVLLYENEKFKTEIESNFTFFSKAGKQLVGLNDYCWSDEDCYKIIFLNDKYEPLKKLQRLEKNENRSSWELSAPLFPYKNELYVTTPFSYTIYKVDEQLNYLPYLTIDLGEQAMKEEKLNLSRDVFLDFLSQTQKSFLVDNFKKNDEFTYFDFFHKQALIHCFASNEPEREVKILTKCILDQNKMTLFPLHIDQTHMYFQIPPSVFIEKHPYAKERFKNVQEADNPIILKVPINQISKHFK